MPAHSYKPDTVCASGITFRIEGDRVTSVAFEGGCSGNLQALGRLVEGMKVTEVIQKLKGIDCDGRGTSCSDQLTRALEAALAEQPDHAGP